MRDKVYATVNIFGLAVALTACLLLYNQVYSELSRHLWHMDKEDVAQVLVYRDGVDGFGPESGRVFFGFGKALKEEVPEIESIVRVYEKYYTKGNEPRFAKGEERIPESRLILSESSLFDVFGYNIVAGSASGLDSVKRSVIISESKAKLYFGSENPVGKTIEMYSRPKKGRKYTVVGVMEDMPKASSLQVDFVLSILDSEKALSWEIEYPELFLKLSTGNMGMDINQKAKAIIASHLKHDYQRTNEESRSYKLHDFGEAYLRGDNYGVRTRESGSARYVFMLIGLTLVILSLALLNFMISVLARSAKDMASDKLRNALGERSRQAVYLLVIEVLSIMFLACALAVLISPFVYQWVGPLLDASATEALRFPPFALPSFFALVFVVSILTALAVTFFKKGLGSVRLGQGKATRNMMRSQKVLLVFQLGLMSVIMIMALVFVKQMRFVREKPLGFDSGNTVIFPWKHISMAPRKGPEINRRLRESPLIEGVTRTLYLPLLDSYGLSDFVLDKETMKATPQFGDSSFIHVYDISLKSGRNINRPSAKHEVLVNEQFVREAGLEYPIGTEIVSGYWHMKGKTLTIVGVLADFHYKALYRPIKPMVVFNAPSPPMILGARVRLNSKNPEEGKAFLSDLFSEFYPDNRFEKRIYTEEDDYNNSYGKDIRFARLVYVLTMVAIFIVMLGLFGFIFFMTQARVKEIGVRKANGATVFEIVRLLNGDLLRYVGVGLILAVPIAYYVMGRWLENFAYRAVMSWWVFAGAGALVCLVALLTVSWQSWRAARREPVEALRYE
ncbi:ABC transporter permease (plasmid) [Fulvitalea axinellae]|uniref:ABC transporter permease n=2 Tax=Fulvitalea axinellae TaxID=1182444 RepID=A0AAU9DEB6_9BACT|nr:ABC transporter permease [Fulvitalea axinellae]